MGIIECLCIIFIVLKLCNLIAWNWLIVLSPMFIGFLIGGVMHAVIKQIKFRKKIAQELESNIELIKAMNEHLIEKIKNGKN